MIAHLDSLGVLYSTSPRSRAAAEGRSSWGRRDYSGGCYTYIHDPNGNMIELVHHPLGLRDAQGNKLELVHHEQSPEWVRHPQYVTSS
jgi:hypothetical protein